MSLNTPALKKITATFVGSLVVIAIVLYIYQLRVAAHSHDSAPGASPRQEVEFESGQVRRQWLEREQP